MRSQLNHALKNISKRTTAHYLVNHLRISLVLYAFTTIMDKWKKI